MRRKTKPEEGANTISLPLEIQFKKDWTGTWLARELGGQWKRCSFKDSSMFLDPISDLPVVGSQSASGFCFGGSDSEVTNPVSELRNDLAEQRRLRIIDRAVCEEFRKLVVNQMNRVGD